MQRTGTSLGQGEQRPKRLRPTIGEREHAKDTSWRSCFAGCVASVAGPRQPGGRAGPCAFGPPRAVPNQLQVAGLIDPGSCLGG